MARVGPCPPETHPGKPGRPASAGLPTCLLDNTWGAGPDNTGLPPYIGLMPRVMAVSFERYGRVYYLDPGEGEYHVGDRVLVPTDSGPEVAECVWAPEWVAEDFGSLPACAGLASEAQLRRDAANRRRRAEAKLVAKRLIKKNELPMKVMAVDFLDSGETFDQMVVIYFTAPQRVDFRVLVSELARSLRARIDLRQVGSRDAARLVGGVGNCGRDLCCATFLNDFEPVSLRMAKLQDLPPNPLEDLRRLRSADVLPEVRASLSTPISRARCRRSANGSTCPRARP